MILNNVTTIRVETVINNIYGYDNRLKTQFRIGVENKNKKLD